MTSTASPFNLTLSGTPAGEYQLLVEASVTSGTSTIYSSNQYKANIIAASASNLAYTPLMKLGINAQLLAAESDKVLYVAGDGTIRLRDISNNQEVVLQNAETIQSTTDWQISGGRVYVGGWGSDCATRCIYQWSPAGVISNLSAADPYAKGAAEHPVAKDGYVVWSNGSARYSLYNVSTQAFTKVEIPLTSGGYVGNVNYDMCIASGNVSFYFWARTGGTTSAPIFDIFKWSSVGSTATKLTNGSARFIYPQTDCSRIVYLQYLNGNYYSLISSDGTNIQTIAGEAQENFLLKDGLLSWRQQARQGTNIQNALFVTSAAGVTSTLTQVPSIQYGSVNGILVYAAAGRVFKWKQSTGQSSTLIDGVPTTTIIASGYVYFTKGVQNKLYKVALN